MSQFGFTFMKLFPHRRGRQPACSSAGQLEISCQLRSSQLRRLRSKRGYGHDSHRYNDHTSHQSKSATKKPVYPTQSNFTDCLADNPGNNSSRKNDCEKNC